MAIVRLGLIGDNIARSQSPRLHVEAGRLCGLHVTYERLIPRDLDMDFSSVFARCAGEGYRGINVTYPYKERVVGLLASPDRQTAMIGACNTVIFTARGPAGHNTDFSGFMAAFQARFGRGAPGIVAMAGAGGVGKAIAFALAGLKARQLRLYDPDAGKMAALAEALRSAGTGLETVCAASVDEAAEGANGLVNCTPIGMSGYPGSAMETHHMRGAVWAFDAVYTPVDTEFLRLAGEQGLEVISGYELFFHQGIDAFRHFTGIDVDAAALRRALGSVGMKREEA